MERKIGEIFEYNGEWHQCLEEKYCNGCVFRDAKCDDVRKILGNCSVRNRSDKKSICFKKLEKVGKPFSCNYYGDARLVMMQEYQLFDENVTYCYSMPPMYITDYKHKRIAIEIKQNKEDMEDNGDIRPYDELFSPGTVSNTKYLAKEYMEDLDKIKVRDYTKVEELNVMEEKKLNLKPFDIHKAREGKPVCTRDGRKARIICFDRKFYHDDGYNYPIVAMVNDNDNELVHAYTQDGLLIGNKESELDLMMLPEKKEGWVNVYKERIYSTKEEAIEATYDGVTYVDTVKVCWEE